MLADSKSKVENLMNLVMQFRKVCNHPELFERRVGRIPVNFCALQNGVVPNPIIQTVPEVTPSNQNPITFDLPKMIWDECFLVNDWAHQLGFARLQKDKEIEFSTVSTSTHYKLFNIFNEDHLHKSIFESNSSLSILRLLSISNKWSVADLAYLFRADSLMCAITLVHFYAQTYRRRVKQTLLNSPKNSVEVNFHSISNEFTLTPIDFIK